ncbi:hypothetical protein [Paracidovorax valerianellae]|uniref:hypothetical protein n=1 Tax=Paracidovorax valerianellae TaxID=187868 RepID=UPI0011144CCF|nr:hypothetical protein [Paracidovorax valerianellae]MDA8445673.1 hypothetical protein [Paracidovorax valerianellae]
MLNLLTPNPQLLPFGTFGGDWLRIPLDACLLKRWNDVHPVFIWRSSVFHPEIAFVFTLGDYSEVTPGPWIRGYGAFPAVDSKKKSFC